MDKYTKFPLLFIYLFMFIVLFIRGTEIFVLKREISCFLSKF